MAAYARRERTTPGRPSRGRGRARRRYGFARAPRLTRRSAIRTPRATPPHRRLGDVLTAIPNRTVADAGVLAALDKVVRTCALEPRVHVFTEAFALGPPLARALPPTPSSTTPRPTAGAATP
ncbi:hypothetical protein JL722_3517 [Aureococcus anophagefferens]|nr:hypothetical protein JL722_3517 [Aureococcus anophagefferens]